MSSSMTMSKVDLGRSVFFLGFFFILFILKNADLIWIVGLNGWFRFLAAERLEAVSAGNNLDPKLYVQSISESKRHIND